MLHRKQQPALVLAEAGEWDALQSMIEIDYTHAQERDSFGMLPLHWACTEPEVPLKMLQTLIDAYPEALRAQTNSQMLPLHIATRSKCNVAILQHLIAAFPDACDHPNGQGLCPIDLLSNQAEDDDKRFVFRRTRENKISHQPETFSPQHSTTQGLRELPDLVRELQLLRESLQSQSRTTMCSHRCSAETNSIASCSTASMSSFQDEEPTTYKIVWSEGDLGVGLADRKEGIQVTKIHVKQNSAQSIASGMEQMRVGDTLVGINNKNIRKIKLRQILNILRSVKRPVVLMFQGGGASRTRPSFNFEDSAQQDMEDWCFEQENMQSRMLVLLTETLARCESIEHDLIGSHESSGKICVNPTEKRE